MAGRAWSADASVRSVGFRPSSAWWAGRGQAPARGGPHGSCRRDRRRRLAARLRPAPPRPRPPRRPRAPPPPRPPPPAPPGRRAPAGGGPPRPPVAPPPAPRAPPPAPRVAARQAAAAEEGLMGRHAVAETPAAPAARAEQGLTEFERRVL